jgi:hypothetical protein
MSGPGVIISAIEANEKSESDSIVLEEMLACSPNETYQTGGVQMNSTSAVLLLLLYHRWGRSP